LQGHLAVESPTRTCPYSWKARVSSMGEFK
jgi:hypothetical protein